jgi:hypothetical protein
MPTVTWKYQVKSLILHTPFIVVYTILIANWKRNFPRTCAISHEKQGRVLSAEESIVDVNQKVSSVHRIVGARKVDAGAYICEVII